jgi:hypothetical protein
MNYTLWYVRYYNDTKIKCKPIQNRRHSHTLGDKAPVVTKNLILRGQPNRNLRDRQLGRFIVEDHIGKHNYILRLLVTPSVSRQQSKTMLYYFASPSRPGYDSER